MADKKEKRISSRVYTGKLLDDKAPFAISESFKRLRTNILYLAGENKCPVFGITSAFQGAGKSILTANLGVAFSQLDKKVLIIDCDMRKPAQHRIFDLENKSGLSEILSGVGGKTINVCRLEKTPT